MLHGIDVSSHQNGLITKNNKWVSSYYDFAIIKITEGTNYKYDRSDYFADQCERKGKLYGLYHYARAEKNNPVQEAEYFLKNVKAHKHALLALDVEGYSLQNTQIDTWARTWLDVVFQSTGKRPLLYISRSLTSRFPKTCDGNYGLWVAEWNTSNVGNVSPWKFWAIWQYDKLDCLNVDMNFFNGDEETFKKYCEPV